MSWTGQGCFAYIHYPLPSAIAQNMPVATFCIVLRNLLALFFLIFPMPHPTSHACDTEVPSLQLLLLVIYQICEIKFEFDKSFRVKYVLGLN